jgi:hypothetical protein
MTAVVTTYQSINCDGCEKTLTFEKNEGPQASQDHPWINHMILVQTPDGRQFSYCSTLHAIEHGGTGVWNRPEEKKVITMGSTEAVNLAAKAAAKAKQFTDQIKAGQPAQVTIER